MRTKIADAACSMKLTAVVAGGLLKVLTVPAGITSSKAEVEASPVPHLMRIAWVMAQTSILEVAAFKVTSVEALIVVSYVTAAAIV